MGTSKALGLHRRAYRDGSGRLRRSRFWSFSYLDAHGRECSRSLKVTERSAAELAAAEIRRDVELQRVGFNTYQEVRASDPLAILEEYVGELRRLKRAPEHVARVEVRLRAFLSRVGALAELTPRRIRGILEELGRTTKPTPRRPQGGLGDRTLNFYRTALYSFFRWLVREDRWRYNPVDAVRGLPYVTNERDRRPLDAEELTRLVATAPLHRGACYLFAATTGLRRGEIAQVREADLDLDAGTWRASGNVTKNSQEAYFPLAPWAVEVLGRYLEETPPERRMRGHRRGRGEMLFAHVPVVPTLKRDLARAEIAWETELGVVDFHALRCTLATWLGREGVPLQLAQKLMRHSDPKLTANVYSRFLLHDYREVVQLLQERAPETAPETARQMG